MSPEEEIEALRAAGVLHKVRADIAERRLREARAVVKSLSAEHCVLAPFPLTVHKILKALGAEDPKGPAPQYTPQVGDKVRCTLEGVLIGYDADRGHWHLNGCSVEGHVAWTYELHWGTTFTPAPQ